MQLSSNNTGRANLLIVLAAALGVGVLAATWREGRALPWEAGAGWLTAAGLGVVGTVAGWAVVTVALSFLARMPPGRAAAAAVLLLAGMALRARRARALEFGLATAAVLLVTGVAWPHYALWLLPPLAWLGAGHGWPESRRRRSIVGGLLGIGLALISLPLPAYEHLFGGLYAASVAVMSVRNLGLLAVFGGLALLARATPDRAGLLAVTSPVLS